MPPDELDRYIYGAEAIARAADLFDKDGKPDVRRAYYALEQELIDGEKFGRIWRSTPRRVRAPAPPLKPRNNGNKP